MSVLIMSNRRRLCRLSSSLRLWTGPISTSVSDARRNATPARWENQIQRSDQVALYHIFVAYAMLFCLQGLRFLHFPYLLTLQLKRFDFDYTTMHRIKLNDRMTFPEELDMSPFIDVEDEVRNGFMLAMWRTLWMAALTVTNIWWYDRSG